MRPNGRPPRAFADVTAYVPPPQVNSCAWLRSGIFCLAPDAVKPRARADNLCVPEAPARVSSRIDAAPLVALAGEREPRREEILELLRSERGGLFVPAPRGGRDRHLLGRRFGPPAQRAFLEDLAARRYESPGLGARDPAAALGPESDDELAAAFAALLGAGRRAPL